MNIMEHLKALDLSELPIWEVNANHIHLDLAFSFKVRI